MTDDEIREIEACKAVLEWDEVWQFDSVDGLPHRTHVKAVDDRSRYLAVMFDEDGWRVERISFGEICPFFGGKISELFPSRQAAKEAARG